MTHTASALYVQTQKYRRAAKRGNSSGANLPTPRAELDAQYDRSWAVLVERFHDEKSLRQANPVHSDDIPDTGVDD